MLLLTNYRDPTAVRSTGVRHGRSVDRVCHWSLVSCIGVGLVSRYDIPRGDRQGMRNLVPYRFVLGVVHCIAFFFFFFIFDSHGVVDLANFECHYNYCPHFYIFDTLSGWLAGKDGGARETQYYCSLFCDFI